ncbi:unnamed protein product [Alopecurus aequalis]
MSNLHRPKRAVTMRSPDWSSLAPDLLVCICDTFLAAGDIDCYVAIRAVCSTWRATIVNPRGPDPRFHPRGWAMLGSLDRDAAGEPDRRRLFLNVNTGRFMWKDMPMLQGHAAHACLAADDTNGLLVVRAASDDGVCVLNRFTGHMVSHPPSWVSLATRTLKVAVDGSRTSLLYAWNSCHAVGKCKPFLTGLSVFEHYYSSTALVTFQGCAYQVDEKGTICRVVQEERDHSTPQRPMMPVPYVGKVLMGYDIYPAPLQTFLVDNAGEVLLVRIDTFEGDGDAQIFRVNLEDKALHAVTSIGSRAILLGNRCLSVDARNLPGIESNCIYYVGGDCSETRTICIYRLEDRSHEELFEPLTNETRLAPALPLSVVEVLMDYPKYEWRLGSACPTWEY